MFKKILQWNDGARDNNNEAFRIAFRKMIEQVDQKGGLLRFVINLDDQGWTAQCQEFPEILTSGNNPEPSHDEISRNIIDAVKTAFDVPITRLTLANDPTTSKEILPVQFELKRQFCLV